MKKHTLKRYLAAMLALLMLLPLISVPTFAEESNVFFHEDFETKTRGDVFDKYAYLSAVQASSTNADNNVVYLPFTGHSTDAYYLFKNNNTKTAFTPTATTTDGNGNTVLSGTATVGGVTYTFSGILNTTSHTQKATITAPAANTGDTLYVTTGALADSYGGYVSGSNIAAPTKFKHAAWKNADVEDFVIEMDLYIPKGAKSTFATSIGGRRISDNKEISIEPFYINASGNTATVDVNGHSEFLYGTSAKAYPLGQWNKMTVVIDKDTSEVSIYMNGAYLFTWQGKSSTTNAYGYIGGPVNFNANAFFFQVNRAKPLSDRAGYAEVDNVTFYNSTKDLKLALQSYHFDSEDQDELTEAAGPYYGSVWNASAKIVPSTTDPSNKVLYTDAIPQSPYQYYLWYGKNDAAPITDFDIDDNGKLYSKTNVTLKGVTYQINASTINTNSFGTPASVVATSGTAQKVYVITGELQDAQNGGTNIATPLKIKNNAWSSALMDQFVLSFDIYFSAGSKGTYQTMLNGTEPLQVVLNGSNGTVQTGYATVASVTTTITLAEWHNITMVLDTKTSLLTAFVDGVFAFSTYCGKSAGSAYPDFTANTFGMQYRRLAYPSGLAGYAEIDNVVFNTNTDGLTLKYYSQNFGAYASKVDQAVDIGTNISATATYAKDPINPANTVVKVPFAAKVDNTEILMRMNGNIPVEEGFYTVTRNATTNAVEVSDYTVTENADGTYNITNGTDSYSNLVLGKKSYYCAYWGGDGAIDQNWKMNHPQIAYNTEQNVILAADYFLSEDANGNFIGQLHRYQSGTTSNTWLELYTVATSTGKITLKNATDAGSLNKGQWNHVEVALNLITGDATLSVNGKEVASSNIGVTNITISAANWSFVKIPRKQGAFTSFAGYVMVDNIEMLTKTATNQVVTVDPENLLYVEVAGKKIYDNTFYITEGTPYTPVYLDVAKYASMIETEQKNSVRVSGAAGLRFATQLNVALLDELFDMIDTGDVLDIEFGHLIAPKDLIATELTKAAMESAGKPYLNVRATYGKYYSFDDDSTTTHFVGSIVDLFEANIARDFAGRGYITLNLKSGSTVNIYSTVTQIANVKNVATKLLDGGYSGLGKDVLETFSQGNAPALSEEGLAVRAMMGLNVLAIGDSLFNGHSLNESDTWIAKMAQTYHWNLTNLGWDGWTVAKNDSVYSDPSKIRASMYDWLMNNSATYCYGGSKASYTYGNPAGVANDEVNLILLEGGTNDMGWGIPLGDINSETDLAKGDNYLGALNQMIIKLKTMYPNATIALVTSWHNLSTSAYTVAGMKSLKNTVYANDDTVVLVDAGNPELNGGVNMANSVFRAEYACTASDVNHLNEKGMEIMKEHMPLLLYKQALSPNRENGAATEVVRVACVGDSITAGGYWQTNLMGKLSDGYVVEGFGVSGSTGLETGIDTGFAPDGSPYGYVTHDAYDRSLASNPDIVVIMLGTNDTKPVNSDRIYADNGAQFKADMIAMVNSYKNLESAPEIYIALPCTIYRERTSGSGINDGDLVNLIIPLLQEVAAETGASTIDVHSATANSAQHFSDGVHPSNDQGRDLIATAIADKIIADHS